MLKSNSLKLIFVLCIFLQSQAQELTYTTVKNLSYFNMEAEGVTNYQKEMNVLDIHYPKVEKPNPVIVWYHGGGLTSGIHEIPEALLEKRYVIVSPSYRLSPKVKPEICINDAVEALAWVFKNISKYNGDPNNIFVSGHSAGGYLALMSVMDSSRLGKLGIDANKIAGVIPFSGHTITHFEIRNLKGIAKEQPTIDKFAPIYYVRENVPPILLITGDREKELLGRYEENAYFYRMMKVAGHKDIELIELKGFGHQMTEPAFPLLLNLVRERSL